MPKAAAKAPGKTIGRPPYVPSESNRRRVAVCAGGGMTHDSIARGLGITRVTLEKHFAEELTTGAEECRQQVLAALHGAAIDGNVSAAREYLNRAAAGAGAAPPFTGTAPDLAPDGLKAARDRAATTADKGSDWAGVLPQHQTRQ